MKFSLMPYIRPDAADFKNKTEALVKRLEAAESFAEADAAVLSMDRESGLADTACTLAQIRHQMDTADPFYDGENACIDALEPELEASRQTWTRALLRTPWRQKFEEKYGALLLQNLEMAERSFSPEIMEELRRENSLCSAYNKLIASAQIPFEGKLYTLAQLEPFKEDPDDARRHAAWQAEGRFYRENGAELDRIFHELTALRHEMALKLGFEDFRELGYLRMQRNCYDRNMVEKFRQSVVKYIVPLAESLYRAQAERLGAAYPLDFADAALRFRDGNAKPAGSAADILREARAFYEARSPETAAFIRTLFEGELLDVLTRKGKAGGGFCTTLQAYGLPFIFANFNGTQGDVEVMTHEAGHAFADYMARDIMPAARRSPSYEACEVHSMSMEFFAWDWAERFFGPDADKFRYGHLAAALCFIPYGTMVDHFQHIIYEKPQLLPAERHAVWRELLGVYMPWLRLDGEIPFYGEGMGWQRQSHIYEDPFYYIDYCLAQAAALQFWALAQQDREGAWAAYMRFVKAAGTATFTQLLETAGLDSPFREDALREICETAKNWLEKMNLER